MPSAERVKDRTLIAAMFVAAFLAIHLTIVLAGISPVVKGELIDTDGYMRALRVERMLGTGAWFDPAEPRSDAPFGESSHWTRPLDAILAAIALPAIPFVGIRRAVFAAGVVLPPLLTLIICLGTAWAVRPLVGARAALIIPIAVLAQPIIAEYSLAGRVDHHSLILALFVMALGYLVLVLSQDEETRYASSAGVLTGLGLWVSTEFLAPLALLLGALAYGWILRGRGRARAALRFSTALAASVIVAVLLERGPAGFLAIEFDRISLPHVLVAGLALAFWACVAGLGRWTRWWRGRLAAATVGAALAAALMTAVFPDFFGGPFVSVDRATADLWLRNVSELHSILPGRGGSVGAMRFHLGPVLVALPWFATRAVKERGTPRQPSWILLLCGLVAFTALALLQRRWSTYAELLAAVGLAGALVPTLDGLSRVKPTVVRTVARAGVVGIALVGFPLVGGVLSKGTRTPTPPTVEAPCALRAALQSLDSDSRPHTILAFMDFGPEILYRSSHRVVATPYHRNTGIVDSHRILSTMTPGEARMALRRREVDIVLLCPARDRGFFSGTEGSSDQETLYARLTNSDPPSWLRRLPVPRETGFVAYELVE